MTFDELDKSYPNGLDDAEITKVVIDYGKRTASFSLNMRLNPPDVPERDAYTQALLNLRGIYYVSFDPPDSSHLFYPSEGKLVVEGLPEDPRGFEPYKSLISSLPVGAFCCRFFVHDWNSFIHIAAADAEFSAGGAGGAPKDRDDLRS